MSYLNIVFSYGTAGGGTGGVAKFVAEAARAGASGLIVPDLPPEETQERYPELCHEHGIHPVFVVSPNTSDSRLEKIRDSASGLLYSTSRTGTTGREMELQLDTLKAFLDRCGRVCRLPRAVGFSISRRDQVESLRGHAEVAVVGTHLIRSFDAGGLPALRAELKALCG